MRNQQDTVSYCSSVALELHYGVLAPAVKPGLPTPFAPVHGNDLIGMIVGVEIYVEICTKHLWPRTSRGRSARLEVDHCEFLRD
jgi:hypothetical protein